MSVTSGSPAVELGSHEQCALLIVDVQNDFVADDGRLGRGGGDLRAIQAAVPVINELIEAGRDARVPIVYGRVEHGPGLDHAPYRARYELRGFSAEDTICHAGSWGAALYEDLLAPRPGDIQVIKHGYDAFHGQPALHSELNSHSVATVVLAGVVTELCVRATASSAFEHGFFVLVAREAIGSADPQAAAAALESIERWYGNVVSTDTLLTLWGCPHSPAQPAPTGDPDIAWPRR
jgi:nicotinamidase-related amidase